MLNRDNDGFETDEPVVGKAWNLDVLGNFNGSPDDDLSVVEFDDRDFDNAFDPAIDRIRGSDHHLVNLNNEITERVTDAGHTAFTYDAAGNLIKDDKHHYFYDAWNRIVRIVRLSDSCEIAKYGYDALGRRVHKQVFKTGALNTDDPGDLFYYDGNRVIDQYRGDGTTSKFYRSFVYGLQYIDEIVAQFEQSQPTAEVECYLIQDANYTVVAAADRRGDLLQQFGRTPYGTIYAADDDRAHPIDFEHAPERLITPFGHQGLWDDLETGLVYNRARYYRPEIGRFLQRDPRETALVLVMAARLNAAAMEAMANLSAGAQYADGLNLYQYLRSNPLLGTDPLGMDFFREIDIISSDMWAERVAMGIDVILRAQLMGRMVTSAMKQMAVEMAVQSVATALVWWAPYAFAVKDVGQAVYSLWKENFDWTAVGGLAWSLYGVRQAHMSVCPGLGAAGWGLPIPGIRASFSLGKAELRHRLRYMKPGHKGRFRGGSHYSMTTIGKGKGYNSHHLPHFDGWEKAGKGGLKRNGKLTRGQAPAIQMDPVDHRSLRSTGNNDVGFRLKQEKLISQGKYKEAFMNEVKDIRSQFGDKYNEAILEAMEYFDSLVVDGTIR